MNKLSYLKYSIMIITAASFGIWLSISKREIPFWIGLPIAILVGGLLGTVIEVLWNKIFIKSRQRDIFR